MTDPQGFADAVHQFDSELDAAVVRARRIASEARETSAKFRRETRQLAAEVKAGRHPASYRRPAAAHRQRVPHGQRAAGARPAGTGTTGHAGSTPDHRNEAPDSPVE